MTRCQVMRLGKGGDYQCRKTRMFQVIAELKGEGLRFGNGSVVFDTCDRCFKEAQAARDAACQRKQLAEGK